MTETPSNGDSTGGPPQVIFGVDGGSAPMPERKAKKRFPIWIPVVLALVAAAAVVGFRYLRLAAPVAVSKAAAPDVDAWMECDLRAVALKDEKLKPLLDAIEESGLDEQVASLLEARAAEAGIEISWEKDIKPWVGPDLGVAVSGLFDSAAAGPGAAKPPTLLGVMSLRNAKKARRFLNNLADYLQSKRGWKVTKQSQLGEEIHVCRPPGSTGAGDDFCYAVTGSMLLVSNRAKGVADSIVRLKEKGKNLSDAEWYQTTIAKAPKDALVRGVFSTENMKGLYQKMGEGLPEEQRKQLEATVEESVTTTAVWLDVTPEGVNSGSFAFPAKQEPEGMREALTAASEQNVWKTGFQGAPKDSIASMSMLGLGEYSRLMAKQIEISPMSFMIQMIQMQTGLDLVKDVFGWIDNLTVTLVNVETHPAGVRMVGEAKAASPEVARAKAEKLAAAARRLGGLTTRPAPGEGVQATELVYSNRPVLCYTVSGDTLLVASERDSLAEALRATQDESARITSGNAWKKAESARKDPAMWAFFVDPGHIARTVESTVPTISLPGKQSVVSLLRSIDWIAMSSAAREDGYSGRFSAAIDYPAFCRSLTELLKTAEKDSARR